jgi:hypothetical protein
MPKFLIKKADTDIYLDNVSLLLPFDSNFNDNSKNNYSVTLYGNPQISTAQSRYGGSSAYFDGGSAINIPTSLIQFDAGQNFTVECWVRLSSYGFRGVIGASTYGTFNITINSSGEVGVSRSNQAQLIASSTLINLNQWYHIAVTRDNGIIKLFINGQLNGSYTDNTIFSAPSHLQIGHLANEFSWWFYGYIDDFRITKGIARYTSNFTPPEKLAFTKVGNKLQISNPPPSILSSTYIRNTVLPILRSSITNFFNYSYDGSNTFISDGGFDMYDGGNKVYLNGVLQSYDTESANTFCYRSYPFIYKTTQTSNFTLNVQGDYGSDGGETMYQYQQDFIHQGRKFSIYIHENIDNNQSDPSIVECFIVYYPISKPTINFTFANSGSGNGNETISVSNLNGQSVTAFYLLLSNRPAVQIGSATLFDVLKTFIVNSTEFTNTGRKFRIKTPEPLPLNEIFLRLESDKNITLNGSNVSAWGDLSGGTRNFSQATTNNQPIFLNGGLKFEASQQYNDGNADYMENTNNPSDINNITGPYTFAVVANLNLGLSTFINASSNNSYRRKLSCSYYNSGGTNSLGISNGPGDGYGSSISNPPLNIGQKNIIIIRAVSNTEVDYFINNNAKISQNDANLNLNPGITTPTPLYLGVARGFGGGGYNAEASWGNPVIYDLFLYNKSLTDSEVVALKYYLNNKHAIY